ncbi:MAG: hypothetical protein GF370_00605 [Candidatus Nealsonbacteria bacterium]|nr:hypothetical protein [Candidatus Nealsonbacteria bacterium]
MKSQNYQLSKEEIKQIMEKEGETRGVAIKSHADFVIKEEGEEGLKKIEERMQELGQPTDFKKISKMKFYPIGLEVIALLTIKEVFGFDEEKIKEMGSFESKTSLLVRIFMKYFVSIKEAASQVSVMWKKNYTKGELRVEDLNQEEQYVKLELKDFSFHPIHCLTLKGYFSSVVKMIVNSEKITCKETKCIHRGDESHEFLVQW